jgi:MoxR-like ATPase
MTEKKLLPLRQSIATQVVGMEGVVESLLICLLASGHALLEGMPGLAKTTLVKALARGVEGAFHRIQFTPDLLPSDVVGTDMYTPNEGEFRFRSGPIFHHFVLADEINRAPAKVQSALLEAMAEKQVTVGMKSYPLPELFMVLATQNPIEQEGTYPLPEAQLDRFFMHIPVPYPSKEEERSIVSRALKPEAATSQPSVMKQADILAARRQVAAIYVDDRLMRYCVDIVHASRNPKPYDANLARWLAYGASPRASIALAEGARALAWLEGAEFVLPQHVQRVAPNILRHRVGLSFEAEAEAISRDQLVARLLEVVAV